MIKTYGYSDGKRGIEAKYEVVDRILTVKIFGSNHWTDYVINFLAWPRVRVSGYRVHPAWYDMAQNLFLGLPLADADMVHISGHSMGGAVGGLLGFIVRRLTPHTVITCEAINAPKSGYPHVVAYYDRGDIVRHFPLLYPKYKTNQIYAVTKPFWEAHNNMPGWWGLLLRGD